MSDLNKIAQEMFGENYSKLSAFAQHSVRLALPRDPIADYEKDRFIQKQAAQIQQLKEDLADALNEVEDLQLEALRRDEEDELRDTRSAGPRQEQAGSNDPRPAAPLEDIRRRDESSVSTELRSGSAN